MRIRGVAVPIAILAVLVILGGTSAALIEARIQAQRYPTPGAAVSPTDPPLNNATQRDNRQQPAIYTNILKRNGSRKGTVGMRTTDAEVVGRLQGIEQTVERNSAYTAGKDAPANDTIGGNIAKLSEQSCDSGPATRSEADCDELISHLPVKAQLKYPKLGSRLNDLAVRVVEEGAASAQ